MAVDHGVMFGILGYGLWGLVLHPRCRAWGQVRIPGQTATRGARPANPGCRLWGHIGTLAAVPRVALDILAAACAVVLHVVEVLILGVGSRSAPWVRTLAREKASVCMLVQLYRLPAKGKQSRPCTGTGLRFRPPGTPRMPLLWESPVAFVLYLCMPLAVAYRSCRKYWLMDWDYELPDTRPAFGSRDAFGGATG